MALVKVKKNYQVIIPQEIRNEMNIAEGDMLEMIVKGDNLEVRPVIVQVKPKERQSGELPRLRSDAKPLYKEGDDE